MTLVSRRLRYRRFRGNVEALSGYSDAQSSAGFCRSRNFARWAFAHHRRRCDGFGETEAALTLAHRRMALSRATGLYVALPTEATANAMYARLGLSFRRLFTNDAAPSLVLSHGRRALHQGFQASVVDAASRAEARNSSRGGDGDERPSSAECVDWIADDRRKAFLADIGAGTIDQALLAISR